MGQQIVLDFTGVKPWTGGGFTHIPPGQYKYRVAAASVEQSRAGKPMIKVTLKLNGQGQADAELTEYFGTTDEKRVGLARLLSLFHSVGLTTKGKELAKINFDVDRIIGREGICNVTDRVMEATEEYSERTISQVSTYEPYESLASSSNGAAPAAAAAAPPALPAAPPTPAPVAAAAAANPGEAPGIDDDPFG